MLQNEYLLQELADMTGISPRTIRYYQQEGLLPEPVSRGKLAYYKEDHLERLKLIKDMKNDYLPLFKIREQLQKLPSDQLKSMLESQEIEKSKQLAQEALINQKPTPQGKDSIKEYTTRLLKRQPDFNAPMAPINPPQPTRQAEKKHYEPGTSSERWQRIALSPGIEIHVREPLPSYDQLRLEELILLARKIFS